MKIIRILTPLILLCILNNYSFAQKENKCKPWFFVQITDPQFGMFTNNKGFEKETFLYEKAVRKINNLNPDFVVITGDFVHDPSSTLQINEFKRITSEINSQIPVYFSPGNHDIGQIPNKQSLRKYKLDYGSDKFSFKHKGSSFIGFNTSYLKANQQKPESKQFKWLSKQLKKGMKNKHVILFCHYPFYNKSINEAEAYSNLGINYREKYLSFFEAHNVDAVFNGHYHNNAIVSYKGIQLITTSAIGKPLSDAPSGMRIVKIYSDRIEHDYFGLDELPDAIQFN